MLTLSAHVLIIDSKNFEHLVDTARRCLETPHDSNHARELAEIFLVYAESTGKKSVTVLVPEPVMASEVLSDSQDHMKEKDHGTSK